MKIDNLSKFIALSIPYSVLVSVAHLSGYWGEFDVDVFSYLGTSDILVRAVVPMLGIAIASAIGVGFSSAKELIVKKIGKSKKVETSTDLATPEKKPSRVIGFYTGFTLTAIVMGGAVKWLVIPVIFAVIVTIFLIAWNYLDKKHRIISDNTSLIFLAVLVVFQAYGYGKYTAINIKDGVSYKYVSSGPDSLVDNENKNIRYLGKIADYFVFYKANSGEQIVISLSTAGSITLRKFSSGNGSESK